MLLVSNLLSDCGCQFCYQSPFLTKSSLTLAMNPSGQVHGDAKLPSWTCGRKLTAKKKFEKLEKSKECKVKKEKMTVSLLSESKKELESHISLARSLQSEIKKLMKDVEVYVKDVDSDDENITTRKVNLRSPSKTPLWNRFTLAVAKTTTEGQSGFRAGLCIGGELPPRH